ncbi:cell division ATPase MinD [Candidatus Woesearchaeota archaeon]|nr:cell division ATPase MinD [Candidatus Woesearchaeota archaeon]
MTRFVAVASGKGGVGKTTTSINLGVALKNLGKDSLVLDGNLTTPDVGLHLGVTNLPVTLHDVLDGKKSILNATYVHASGLKVIPADISFKALKRLNFKKLRSVFDGLKGTSEVIIIDCGAGLSKDVLSVMRFADEALIVTNPELSAVTNALKTIKAAEENNITVLGVVLNKVKDNQDLMSIENVEALLDKPIVGVIPETDYMRKALKAKHPLVYYYPKSDAAKAFKKLASGLIGDVYEEHNEERKGLFGYILQKLGLKK